MNRAGLFEGRQGYDVLTGNGYWKARKDVRQSSQRRIHEVLSSSKKELFDIVERYEWLRDIGGGRWKQRFTANGEGRVKGYVRAQEKTVVDIELCRK